MTIAHAYTLLLEAVVLTVSFGILWLSFWMRDRLQRPARSSQQPPSAFASDHQHGAMVAPLSIPVVGSAVRLAIDLATSDIQPASEKDKAILYRPEHAQYLSNKPQIQAEQNQRA